LEELMRTADPLGMFSELKNIQPIEGDDYASLYQNVLVDLPVGVYFRKFLNEVTEGAASDENSEIDAKFISDAMKDYNLQQIQLRVRKIWLNEFFDFCEVHLPETSGYVMGDLLKFEADCQTIQIIANSLMVGGMPNSVNRDMERRKYISKVGYLYPERDEKLRNVSDLRSLVSAVESTPYEKILSSVAMNDDRNEAQSDEATIDDVMLAEASRRYSIAFEGGFHVGCFFAYLKLKEQEIKNVTWLAELVQMQVSRNLPGWSKYISPFMYHANDVQQK
jgi:V-type H+-transporting ATPase subunit d